VHPYERIAFDRANSAHMQELTYLAASLDPTTAPLAEGYAAVVPSLSDNVDAMIECFIVAARASADQVGPDLRAKGMLFPSQANILETEVTTAARVAEFMFDKGLAQAKRPRDLDRGAALHTTIQCLGSVQAAPWKMSIARRAVRPAPKSRRPRFAKGGGFERLQRLWEPREK
jgi:hypothetical protein